MVHWAEKYYAINVMLYIFNLRKGVAHLVIHSYEF